MRARCMRMASVWVLGALLLAAAILPAAVAGQQQDVLTADPQTFELTQGWYQGRETYYYDFGANTQSTDGGARVQTAPIYVLVQRANGDPQPVEGQQNIIDVIPGDEGYSDLWEVMLVEVPADYEANTLRSAQAVIDAGYPMTQSGDYVNCPVVPEGSTLAEGGAPLVQGWYQDQEVYYFDFGANEPITAPIYAFATGFDADGNPQFVEGQANVIDVIPGDPGYSAFWFVNVVIVPADYEANTLRSAQEVVEAGYEMRQPGLTVNCPVLRTASQAAQPGATPGATMTPSAGATAQGTLQATAQAAVTPTGMPGTLPETGGALVGAIVPLVAGGAVLVGLGLGLRRPNR